MSRRKKRRPQTEKEHFRTFLLRKQGKEPRQYANLSRRSLKK